MRKTSTFREQLEQLSDENFARVAARAQLANQLAKSCSSRRARRRAYDVKAATIEHSIRVFPERCALSSYEQSGRLVCVGLEGHGKLHLPTLRVADNTQNWIDTQRRRILRMHRELLAVETFGDSIADARARRDEREKIVTHRWKRLVRALTHTTPTSLTSIARSHAEFHDQTSRCESSEGFGWNCLDRSAHGND